MKGILILEIKKMSVSFKDLKYVYQIENKISVMQYTKDADT